MSAGIRVDQLRSVRARTHHEIQSLQRLAVVDPGRAQPTRLAQLLALRDRLDDELGQPRVPRPKVRKRRDTGPNRVDQLLEALDVTARDVKEWAVHEGLVEKVVRGRIGLPLVLAYAEAHGRA